MNAKHDWTKLLAPQYFWDVDLSKLNEADSKRLIIERVLNLGTLKEINGLIDYYGRKEVIKMIHTINYMDPKTLHFVSRLFDIPLSSLRCCTRKSSKSPHWNS
jgi:hypothetical protein